MYLKHFELDRQPFAMNSAAGNWIMAPGFRREYRRCAQAIERQRGPVLITGPAGCGKTTMLAAFEQRFGVSHRIIPVNGAMVGSRIEMLQCMLFELGMSYGHERVGDLRLALVNCLRSQEQCPDGMLMLVDDAHTLVRECLEELHVMTSMACAGKARLQMVIAGQQAIEENLGELESFNQRIGLRSWLAPMTQSDTMLFTLAQIQLCGRDGREIFLPSALEKLHELSGGIPRIVCQVADCAMQMAADNDETKINGDCIQAAWCELHQLPCPPTESAGEPASDDDIVEFGSLTDESPAAEAPAPSGKKRATQSPPVAAGKSATREMEESRSTLDSLLHQLDEMERSDQSPPASRPGATAHQEPDSDQLFGGDYEHEEEVFDVQTRQSTERNRRAAEQRVNKVGGAEPPPRGTKPSPARPAWNTWEPEIVSTTLTVSDIASLQLDCSNMSSTDAAPRTAAGHKSTEKPSVSAKRGSGKKTTTASRDEVEEAADSGVAKRGLQREENPSVSTGQAIRMDYQDLFRQLQNDATRPGPRD